MISKDVVSNKKNIVQFRLKKLFNWTSINTNHLKKIKYSFK